MDMTLLSVEPSDGHWQVVLDEAVLATDCPKSDAIELACRFARNRHEVTGEPTGVVVPLCNGEVVLYETCGCDADAADTRQG